MELAARWMPNSWTCDFYPSRKFERPVRIDDVALNVAITSREELMPEAAANRSLFKAAGLLLTVGEAPLDGVDCVARIGDRCAHEQRGYQKEWASGHLAFLKFLSPDGLQ
jgi:hypothetical protein